MNNQHRGIALEQPQSDQARPSWESNANEAVEMIASYEPGEWLEIIEYMRNTLRGRASMACQDFEKMSKNWAEVADKI